MNPVWHFLNGNPQRGPIFITPGGVTSTAPWLLPAGSLAASALRFGTMTANTGLFDVGSQAMGYTASGTKVWQIGTTVMDLTTDSMVLRFGSSGDATLTRGAATRLNTGTAGTIGYPGANEQLFDAVKQLTELTTIANAPTTDTTIQMPANSVVLGVSVRVTVAIPTATTFTVGDSGSAARFSTAAVSVNLNSTDPGTKAGAYYNASALSIRITPNGTPANNNGRVRVTIYYYTVTPPTS